MLELTAERVAALCGGALRGEPAVRARGFVADSRQLRGGEGFVALRGGHAYVGEAFAAGAALVVVERGDAVPPPGRAAVVVRSTEAALAALAAEARARLRARVVGITGSTGKTLTKDLLAAALAARFAVHATPHSYNNEVGLPLTLLGCPQGAEVVVAEMGARHRGDIAALCRIARPEAGIICGIGLAHLELFGSRRAIAEAKGELLEALPASGLAVLPAADDFLGLLASRTAARVVTVGPGGAVRVLRTWLDGGGMARGVVAVGREVVEVRLPVPGQALVRNAALALAAAAGLGVPAAAAAQAMAAARPSGWRMEVVQAGGRTILNDAYNANPTSLRAALRAARDLAQGRPLWAVLGSMAELGPVAEAEHRRAGRLAAALGFERVLAVGGGAAAVAEGAGERGMRVGGAAEAAAIVAREAPADAVVVVKGSRVAGLEETVRLLCGELVG